MPTDAAFSGGQARSPVAAQGVSVSAWMAEAARVAREVLAAVGEWEWEAEHGPLSDEELAAARSRVAGPGAERKSA
jgi:hypothetical protein